MKGFLLGIGRLLLLAVVAALGLVGGFWAGETYCIHFVVPGWVKQYPHDGQLGLGVFGYALFGAFVGLIVAGILVAILISRFARDRRALQDESPRESGDSPTELHLS